MPFLGLRIAGALYRGQGRSWYQWWNFVCGERGTPEPACCSDVGHSPWVTAKPPLLLAQPPCRLLCEPAAIGPHLAAHFRF